MAGVDLDWIARATGAKSVQPAELLQTLWGGYGEARRVLVDGTPVIVKSVSPPRRDDESHQRKMRSYDVELAWYQHYANSSPSRVARLVAGERRGDEWLFVLEDLDAAGFSGRRGDPYLCLAWLARFHLHFFNDAPTDLWPRGTYWHLGTRMSELARIEDPDLRAAAPIIDARLQESFFQTLVHGDAKPDNFCFGDHGVAAVDFQYVGPGCAMSDVAYLICGDEDEYLKLDAYCGMLNQNGADAMLVAEARRIYPIAAADFYRFYAGWAPNRWRSEHYGQKVIRQVLMSLF